MTMVRATMNGRLEVVQWMRTQPSPCPWDIYELINAVAHGQWEVVQWMRKEGCPWDTEQVFYYASTRHQWTILKGLLDTTATSDIPPLTKIQAWLQYQPHRPECYQLRRALAAQYHLQWNTDLIAWLRAVDTLLANVLDAVLCPDLVSLVTMYT